VGPSWSLLKQGCDFLVDGIEVIGHADLPFELARLPWRLGAQAWQD
jgi:hypothetical protein